jgi:hypothetical protein
VIVKKKKNLVWNNCFIADICRDLQMEFLSLKWFSKRNLELMRQWCLFYSLDEALIAKQIVSQFKIKKVPQVMAEINLQIFSIPCGHNIVMVNK